MKLEIVSRRPIRPRLPERRVANPSDPVGLYEGLKKIHSVFGYLRAERRLTRRNQAALNKAYKKLYTDFLDNVDEVLERYEDERADYYWIAKQ